MRRLPIGPPERGQRGKGAHRVLAGRNHPTRVTGQSKCVPPKMKEYYSTGGIADSLPSSATVDTYAIHTGDTPGLHRSLPAPTPSGRRGSKAGGRQEGAFATPSTPISYAPHQGSPYAFRSGHQVGTAFHRLRELDAAL